MKFQIQIRKTKSFRLKRDESQWTVVASFDNEHDAIQSWENRIAKARYSQRFQLLKDGIVVREYIDR